MTEPRDTPDEIESPVLASGTRLGKYEIGRQLGAGGMGAVYEATHTEIGKRVAIKVLSPAIAAIPGARARFLREAQLTSKIRHPNIVDVADMGNDGGQTYIVMELLAGEDLAGRLQRGPLPAAELADVMLPVCAAVVAAHRAGVTHRDLKPQNIFLARGPHGVQPKVLDFGISKGGDTVGAGTLTGTGSIIGTPYYFAPEQIVDARAAGPGTDQYALGVIMYECLTGRRPYEGDTLFVVFQTIVNGAAAPLRAYRPDLPAALEAVVLRAMHVDQKQRFPSTDGLGRALLPFASARQRSIWEDAFEAGAPADASVNASAREAAATTPWQPANAATTPWRPVMAPAAPGAGMTPTPPPLVTPRPAPLVMPTPMPLAARMNTYEGGGSANELFDLAPRARSGKRKLVIAVVAFGVAAGVGFIAMRPSGERAPQASAPSVTPPPAPAAQPPPPAPAASAPPAAVPPPAPAAPVTPPPAPVATAKAPADSAPGPAAASASGSAKHPAPHARPHAKPVAPAPGVPAPRALNPNAAPVVD